MADIWQILWIPAALLWANGLEWAIHKYVLHGLGKKKNSMFAFHWHDHHKLVRKSGGYDKQYAKKEWWRVKTIARERFSLALLLLANLPLLFFAPIAWFTLLYAMINYYRVHRKSHLDVEWAKKHVPWHWEHHMGKNQNANLCITRPWFDWIMGTRVHYLNNSPLKR